MLRDFVNPETVRIVLDSRENFTKLASFAEIYTPAVQLLRTLTRQAAPLFDLFGVEDEIQKALARRVDLKSGGYLIFDQTGGDDDDRRELPAASSACATSTTPSSDQPRSGADHRPPAAPAGISAASSSSISSTWMQPSIVDAVLAEFNKALARDHAA